MTTEQVTSIWNRHGVAAYCFFAALCLICFGYSLCSFVNRNETISLVAQHNAERRNDSKLFALDKKYLREQLLERNKTIARQSDQLAMNGNKAADGTKAAIQLIEKQMPEGNSK